jgi:hypothetical protein
MRNRFAVLLLFYISTLGLWAQTLAQPKQSGAVQVLYAGSLGSVLEKTVGPEFERARDSRFREKDKAPCGPPK